MISFKRSTTYGSLTIETQGVKALIMKRSPARSPAEVENENQRALGFGFGLPASWKFANGASFKMGRQVEVEVGIPNETEDSVSMELIHLKEGEDNYSLTVNVDGLEVGRTSCCSGMLRNLTDVRIIISDSGYGGDLIVLDKA